MRLLVTLYVALAMSTSAFADINVKDPWNYPVKQYGFVLLTALLGGLVSWYAKVRKGELMAWNVMHLIGELATSAFAGLLAFWLCEWSNSPAILTPALVGIAGHMGTRGLQAFEDLLKRRFGPNDEEK